MAEWHADCRPVKFKYLLFTSWLVLTSNPDTSYYIPIIIYLYIKRDDICISVPFY